MRVVRLALLTAVTCAPPRGPPVRFQISHVSMFPNTARPSLAANRAPGTLSRIHRIFGPEKYVASGNPTTSRNRSAPAPAPAFAFPLLSFPLPRYAGGGLGWGPDLRAFDEPPPSPSPGVPGEGMAWPAASASQISFVRVSCHTIALHSGTPVFASHTTVVSR